MTQSIALLIAFQFGCAKQRLEKMKPPTAQEVFERYDKVTSPDGTSDWNNLYMSGQMEMPLMNASFPLESWMIKDGGTLTTYEIPNIGTGGQGYNLQYAWALDPVKGDRLLEGAEFDSAKSEYDSLFVDSFADLYRDIVVAKSDTVEEQDVWIVEAIEKSSDKPTKLFFSIDTGLLIAQYKEIPSGKGSVKSKMYFEEYQNVEGTTMLMPAKIRLKIMGMTQYLVFESLQIDVENPPTIEPPQSVLEFIDTDTEKSLDSENEEMDTSKQEIDVEGTVVEEISPEQERTEDENQEDENQEDENQEDENKEVKQEE